MPRSTCCSTAGGGRPGPIRARVRRRATPRLGQRDDPGSRRPASRAPRATRRHVTLDTPAMSLMPATLPATPAPELPIRLIALDIDGTIIGDDHVITERTITSVRDAMAADVAVSLVTGRMVSSAMRFATDLGLTGPIVGYQGGLIRAMPLSERRLGKLLLHT